MSVKYQITLPEKLAFQLREASRQQQIPLAQFIRETMEEKLARLRKSRSRDQLASIHGLVEGEPDWSTTIDEVLAGSHE